MRPCSCKKNAKLITVIEGDSNPQVFIPELISLHKEGRFPIERLVKVYPAEEIDEAMADMKDGKVKLPGIHFQTFTDEGCRL